ncbi:BTB domain-containing protein [Favolaschia claudopus]|uniref:BTB domain-containing protein n=1 Tax=Favolaschia claudopus TaxID=2862362 RepID=A0AAW0B820_9AGAR
MDSDTLPGDNPIEDLTRPSTPVISDSMPTDSKPIRDEQYFFDDGDCVFLVGDHLFKLHKTILSRDPDSAFSGMFSLPTENGLEPITLTGDTVSQFRELCWALYALPTEIQAQNNPNTQIERLVAVANMSHKYSLASFEFWAIDIILIHCKSSRDYLKICHPTVLESIYQAATAAECRVLQDLVEEKWLLRLKSRKLQLRHALDFAEAHGMQNFLAMAYFQQARDMKSCALKLNTGSEVADYSSLNLTEAQLHRLLAGYCSLTLYWQMFKETTLPSCDSAFHESAVRDIAVCDPEDPLNVLEGFNRTREKCETDSGCSCRKNYIDKLISNFSVAKHFGL